MDIVHYSYRIINFKGTWHFMKKIILEILTWVGIILGLLGIILLLIRVIKGM